ncbi:alpha/beta hydrolase [Kitasatospora sp. NBC_01560]|uniref:alpha/beta fold hydrolase n=1 Tax=Kitasatospora sp. NBC_01560 TaxID=2975965 RepID=UPI003866CB5C
MTSMETESLTSMTDGAQIRWTVLGDTTRTPPVVLLHGGPGLPDYLGAVARMIADLAPVHRYDQRGTGGSPWQGRHTFARHVDDLAGLLDRWGAAEALLIGHSYGSGLAARFCLAHPDRVAGLLLMCGPFVGDWRTGERAERSRRMSAAQQERLDALERTPDRTEGQEVELLTLAWFADHADPERGWGWAAQGARQRRPVNWAMNSELGTEGRADPLDGHLDELRACLPARVELLGGACDPRPLSALESLALRWEVPLRRIEDAGHEPWLEQPDTVREHLRAFVRGTAGRQPAPRAGCPRTPNATGPDGNDRLRRPSAGSGRSGAGRPPGGGRGAGG